MKQPRILITGVSGFVGRHLVKTLQTKGYATISGLNRSPTSSLKDLTGVHFESVDLLDAAKLQEALQTMQPDWIFHLAGQSVVADSWTQPETTFSTNVLGQVNLFEALHRLKAQPRILVAGSSEEYGSIESQELPVQETQPFRPLSPYAVSKVAQDLSAYQYFRSYQFDAVRTRAFNHTGPGRSDRYAVSGFCRQMARIDLGLQPPVIAVGNLEAERDFLDVRDVADAYVTLLEKGVSGEAYNICSGKPRSLASVLEMVKSCSSVQVTLKRDPARLRPSDIPTIYGDSSKLRSLSGWSPKISLEQTVKDLFQYWHSQESERMQKRPKEKQGV